MKHSKIFIGFIFGMVVLTSIIFVLVQKIEREINQLQGQDKKEKLIDIPREKTGIEASSTYSIILSQEFVEGYGESIDSPEDDELILSIIKKDLNSLEEETIYRIRKKRVPDVEVEMRNQGIFIQRNLLMNDNLLIDFSGNELPVSEFDLSSGIYSSDEKLFIYLEKGLKSKVNLVNLEKQEITVLPIEFTEEEMPELLGFIPSNQAFLLKYKDNRKSNFVLYNFKEDENINLDSNIEEIFISENNIYSMRYAVATSNFYLDQWGETSGSEITSNLFLELGEGKVNKLIEKQNKIYLQIDNTIYAFSEGLKSPLISDAELLEVINANTLIYRKYSEINRALGVFVFDVNTQTSKEIYQNKLTDYGTPNYREYDFLGVKTF